jgi:biofilm PGA synthesis N-glycosyltransferase PgaC
MNAQLIALIILIIFALSTLVQLFYYFFIYGKFLSIKPIDKNSNSIPVSIIICARNEDENLEKYLPLILEQKYKDYEVVVVNDCSEDDTEDVLKRLMAKYPHLRTTFIKEDEKFRHGKKLALTVGIKSAKNEWLLLTDADCYPESDMWLANMAQHFTDDASIVLGYGGYCEHKGMLNKLIRFDTVFIALQYFTFALFGKPYMGVGRNLSYRKTLFFSNKGFASHARLDSGDDDLFINEVATNNNVKIEADITTHTRSEPKKTFDEWVEQKTRHLTTFKRYKMSHRILLGGEVFSRVFFYFSLVALLILQYYWIVVVSVFVFRLITQMVIFKNTVKRLNEKNLLLISLIFDIILPFLNLGIYMSNAFRPKRQWR